MRGSEMDENGNGIELFGLRQLLYSKTKKHQGGNECVKKTFF